MRKRNQYHRLRKTRGDFLKERVLGSGQEARVDGAEFRDRWMVLQAIIKKAKAGNCSTHLMENHETKQWQCSWEVFFPSILSEQSQLWFNLFIPQLSMACKQPWVWLKGLFVFLAQEISVENKMNSETLIELGRGVIGILAFSCKLARASFIQFLSLKNTAWY